MPLPFGLKLKRTRRYTVSSKSCLVARIQLLNNEFVEFTLSVESTGQESLEAVAQRLELREVSELSSYGVALSLVLDDLRGESLTIWGKQLGHNSS